jgi:hypothetical protein
VQHGLASPGLQQESSFFVVEHDARAIEATAMVAMRIDFIGMDDYVGNDATSGVPVLVHEKRRAGDPARL